MRKSRIDRILFFVCILALLCSSPVIALAEEDINTDFAIMLVMDENEEPQFNAPAFVSESGTVYVDSYVMSIEAAGYVLLTLENDIFYLEYLDVSQENGIALFELGEQAGGEQRERYGGFYTEASAYEGEAVSLVFPRENLESWITTAEITEYLGKDDFAYYLDINITGDANVPEDLMSPGALLNENGEMVGIFTSEGSVISFNLNPDNFSNSSGEGQSETQKSDGTRRRSGGNTETVDEPDKSEIIGAAVVGIVIVLVAAVFLRRRSSRKKVRGSQMPETVMVQSKMFLCGRGGMMDGNNYPIVGDSIIIGRDSSCSIRYPADTRGISRKHCRIFLKDGVLMLEDLGSTAGTYLAGKGRLIQEEAVTLRPGDSFYLGEEKNTFVIRE